MPCTTCTITRSRASPKISKNAFLDSSSRSHCYDCYNLPTHYYNDYYNYSYDSCCYDSCDHLLLSLLPPGKARSRPRTVQGRISRSGAVINRRLLLVYNTNTTIIMITTLIILLLDTPMSTNATITATITTTTLTNTTTTTTRTALSLHTTAARS